MIWYKEKKRVLQSQLIESAKGYAEYRGRKREEYTKEDIIEVLFGDEFSNDFYVYWWDNPYKTKKTILHRFNLLWFMPIFLVFIAPYQWITRGEVGFDERTKVGQIVCKILGEK